MSCRAKPPASSLPYNGCDAHQTVLVLTELRTDSMSKTSDSPPPARLHLLIDCCSFTHYSFKRRRIRANFVFPDCPAACFTSGKFHSFLPFLPLASYLLPFYALHVCPFCHVALCVDHASTTSCFCSYVTVLVLFNVRNQARTSCRVQIFFGSTL